MSAELEPKVHGAEHLNGAENSAEQKEKLEKLLADAKEAKQHSPEEVQKLSHEAHTQAISGKEYSSSESEHQASHTPSMGVTRALKKQAYKKVLSQARKQLSPSERTFSSVIHSPTIEKASDIGAKTVARPSGILTGGIVAFVGSSVLFYMSKHYGYRYNPFVFIALLVIGFVAGLLLELVFTSMLKRQK